MWWYVIKKPDCQAATLKPVSLYQCYRTARYTPGHHLEVSLTATPQTGVQMSICASLWERPARYSEAVEGAEMLCTSLPAPRTPTSTGSYSGPVLPVKAPGPAKRPPGQRAPCGTGGAPQITTCALALGGYQTEPSRRLPHCPGIQACKPGCLM